MFIITLKNFFFHESPSAAIIPTIEVIINTGRLFLQPLCVANRIFSRPYGTNQFAVRLLDPNKPIIMPYCDQSTNQSAALYGVRSDPMRFSRKKCRMIEKRYPMFIITSMAEYRLTAMFLNWWWWSDDTETSWINFLIL